MLNRKEKTVLFFFAALILGAVVYSIDRLLLNSLLTWQFLQKPYLLMLGELALVFILFLILGLFGPAKIKFPAIIAVLSVFYGFTRFSSLLPLPGFMRPGYGFADAGSAAVSLPAAAVSHKIRLPFWMNFQEKLLAVNFLPDVCLPSAASA